MSEYTLAKLVLALVYACSTVTGQNVIWAINAGGDAHIANGIAYQKDTSTDGLVENYGTNITIERVTPEDAVLFTSIRYDSSKFGYKIPLTGNGEYLLVLKFSENKEDAAAEHRLINVVLNKKHEVITGLDVFKRVGKYNAYFEYVYFKIEENILHYKNELSKIVDGNLRLEFLKNKGEPFVSAIVLYGGDVETVPQLNFALTDHDNAVIKYYVTEILKENTFNSTLPIIKYTLTRDIQVAEIVRQTVYIDETTDTRLFHLLKSMPDQSQILVGYKAAFDEISKTVNDWIGYNYLVFGFFIDKFIQLPNFETIEESKKVEFEMLKAKTTEAVDVKIAEIAKSINTQDYEQIEMFAVNYTAGFIYYAKDIVKSSISSNTGGNVKNVLAMVNHLEDIEQDLSVYEALLNVVKTENGTLGGQLDLMFAVFLKQTFNKPSFAEADEKVKERFTKLKNSLPENVKDVVTKYVLLKSSLYKEYLFSDWTTITGSDKLKIYTALNKSSEGLKFNWKLDVPDSFSAGFSVQNVFGDYLVAGSGGNSSVMENHPVFLWIFNQFIREAEQSEWIFEPVENSTRYVIRNKSQNEFLLPASDEDTRNTSDKRLVYTKLVQDCGEQCHWEIEPF